MAGTVDGFVWCDIDGENLQGLAHVSGFLADYPTSSEVLNVLSQNTQAPFPILFPSLYRKKEAKSTAIQWNSTSGVAGTPPVLSKCSNNVGVI